MSIKAAADHIRTKGRGKDTELVHMTKREVDALSTLTRAAGGEPSVNPKTGLPEYGFLDSLLPTILGAAANFFVPGSGMVVGGLTGALQNKDNPLMGAVTGAMGGYGGGQMLQGIQGLGATAAQNAVPQVAVDQLANNAIGQGLQVSPLGQIAGPGLKMGSAPAELLGQEAARKTLAAQAASDFAAQPISSQLGQGIGALVERPMSYVEQMGGVGGTLKNAGMALSPLLTMTPEDDGKLKRPGEGEGRRYSYDAGYTGGDMVGEDISSERQWFDHRYTPMAAGGRVQGYAPGGMTRPAQTAAPQMTSTQATNPSGAPSFSFDPGSGSFSKVMESRPAPVAAEPGATDPFATGMDRLSFRSPGIQGAAFERFMQNRRGLRGRRMAEGGQVEMETGGFVVPADVVSMAGGGSTDAGLAALAKRVGARPIKGPGDGMSDDIPATIDGAPVARVANGEAYVPRDTVKKLGGARKLYKAMDNIRKQAHGKTKQQRPVNLDKALA